MSQHSLLKTGFKRLLWALLSVVLLVAGTLWAYKDKIVLGAEAYLFGYPLVMMETTRVHSQKYIGPENGLRRVQMPLSKMWSDPTSTPCTPQPLSV